MRKEKVMNVKNPVEVAIRFIEMINRRDFDALAELMSSDHSAMDANGRVNQGRDVARKMIADYIRAYPDFQIHINEIYEKDGTVIIVGRTTGSCNGTRRDVEIKDRLLYVIKVKDGLATEFQYAMEDTPKKRAELAVDQAIRITE
jgi:ketosteroid isomerase-like protein